ncbi:Uncharacterised protein [Bacillus freudenreichii]|nr:Uncharacterised protein [Bacillus freudenreichii]
MLNSPCLKAGTVYFIVSSSDTQEVLVQAKRQDVPFLAGLRRRVSFSSLWRAPVCVAKRALSLFFIAADFRIVPPVLV